ncbi:MAG: cytochrome C, partial [Deltaproteobacteria bacterium]|nr:cytochrome C [Deltaproteobacteria bacterium]
ENYIRDSIMNPNANVVKGFQPLMPTYKGTLSDDEINGLVAYIKSL